MLSPMRLLRVAALVAALAALPVGGAAGAGPESETVVRVELDLPASNGLHAHLETSEDEDVTLEIWRKRDGAFQAVTYEVPGEVSEAGLKVRFGRLGLIDVAFTPTVTLDETEVSPGCTGEPRTLREGVFAGTIAIAGERDYVRIEAPQAEGSMSVIPPWKCPVEDEQNPFEPIPAAPQLTAETAKKPLEGAFLRSRGRAGDRERETATLFAGSRGCSCYFLAGVHHRHSGGRSIFYAVRVEDRERMEILRLTSVRGAASAFDYDHEAGTARLDPPPPFRGHATFRRRDRGGDRWRSTILVPILGSPLLRTGGRGSGADLYPEYQFD
ncbi:MAG TPA: hypothetical protein VFN92_11220 [Solirubrobacterales bacterium]|nr:hypothetical protein [Solirubrobacterales bacterium]